MNKLISKCKLFQKNELQTFTQEELSCINNLDELKTILKVIPSCYEALFLFQINDEQWRQIVNQNELNELHLLIREFFITNLEQHERNIVLAKILNLWEDSFPAYSCCSDAPDYRHSSLTTIHKLVPVEGSDNWFINAIPNDNNLHLFSDVINDILYRQYYLSKDDKVQIGILVALLSSAPIFITLMCLSALALSLLLALAIAGPILFPTLLATAGIVFTSIAALGIVGAASSSLLGALTWVGLALFYHVPKMPEDLKESLTDVKFDKVSLLSSVIGKKLSNNHQTRFFQPNNNDIGVEIIKYNRPINETHYTS